MTSRSADHGMTMSRVSHQTIKLSKGKHSSPEDGACVMELASMLAGEPFSDHPASVCPVIGSFLRAYNDSIDDERRQDLYTYASDIVGTRSSLGVQRERAALLMEWALRMRRRRWANRLLLRTPTSRLHRRPSVHAVGPFAVRAIPRHTAGTHAAALDLLETLLRLGEGGRPSRPPDLADELPRALYPVI